MTSKVLIIEDDAPLRQSIAQTLDLEGFQPIPTVSFTQARRMIRSNFDGVILSDIRMPDHGGFDVLAFAQGIDADLPVILLTGHSDVPTAMRAMREGAYDYLEKPCGTEMLTDTIRRALLHRNVVLQNRAMARQIDRNDIAAQHYPGNSEATRALRNALREAAASRDHIHLFGARGVGKRTAAFVIHSLGEEETSYEAINCETATVAGIDALEPLDRATLSIKNLGDADPPLLERLTRLLAARPDLRLMTTANCRFADTGLATQGHTLREIYVPNFEERAPDLPQIFEACLRQAARASGVDVPVIASSVIDDLRRREWPGNLDDMRRHVSQVFADGQGEPATLTDRVELYEKGLIEEALGRHNGNVADTAKALGVPRNTLYDRMSRFGLVAKDFRSPD